MIKCYFSKLGNRPHNPVPTLWASFEMEERHGLRIRTKPFQVLIDTGSDATWIPESLVINDAKRLQRQPVRIFNSEEVRYIKAVKGRIYLGSAENENIFDLDVEDGVFVCGDEEGNFGLIGLNVLKHFTLTLYRDEYITLEQ